MNLKESQVKLLTENPGSDQHNRLASQFSKEQLKKKPTSRNRLFRTRNT